MTRRLVLKSEPSSYGADARPPAPEWLIEGTPGAPELSEKLTQAKEAAREAQEARNAAIRAFREASRTDRNNEWSPLPTIEYDRWRILRNTMDDAERAERTSHRPVKAAWHALRDHLAQSDQAVELADSVASARADEARAAAVPLKDAVQAFSEAANLIQHGGVTRENFDAHTSRRLALSNLAALVKAVEAYMTPEKPWRFTRRSA